MGLNINDENLYVEDGVLKEVKNKAIREAIIPAGVIRIGSPAIFKSPFRECNFLTKVTLPEGIERIPAGAFSECRDLQKIDLPESIKEIGPQAFYCCHGLKEIILPEGLESIDEHAFWYCSSLEKMTIPASVKQIGELAFFRCESLKEVTIIVYTDEASPKPIFDSEVRRMKRMIKKNASYLPKDIKFEVIYKQKEEEEKPNSQEIEDRINKIKAICEKLPDNFKAKIYEKVNNLLKEYEKHKDSVIPQYSVENDMLSLSLDDDIGQITIKLLANLDTIYLELAHEEKQIEAIQNIEKYQDLAKKHIEELSDDATLEGQIQNIIYLISSLDETRKNKYFERLNKILNESKEEAIDYLNYLITELTGEYKTVQTPMVNPNFEMNLKTNVSMLYDEVKYIVKTIKPYQELLDSLSGKDISNEENEITKDINIIRLIFSKLTNGKYKDELIDKYNKISIKYQEIITKIISDDETLKNTKYKNIVIELRQELQPLLELINSYALLVKYDLERVNIHDQIKESIDIVNNDNSNGLNIEDYNQKVITSYVIEIYGEILENNQIPEVEKTKIKKDILTVLNESLSGTESLGTNDEYLKTILKIRNKLTKIKEKVDNYIAIIDSTKKFR